MKKFTLILAAIFAVAFTAPVFAADNLELSGDFYLRGWNIENKDYTDTKTHKIPDSDNSGSKIDYPTDNDQSNFDQRIRLQGKINATDNAYVVIRADIGETSWGLGFAGENGVQRPRNDEDNYGRNIDFDRLYGHFENENVVLSVGQQHLGLGINEVVDANMPSAVATLKLGPVIPTFVYAKGTENGSIVDEGVFSDIDLYATNIGLYLGQNLRANVFGVYGDLGYVGNMSNIKLLKDRFNTFHDIEKEKKKTTFNAWQDGEAWVLGFHATGSFGMVNLTSELSFLNGTYNAVIDTYDENATDPNAPATATATVEVEATGTQFYVKADSDVTDMFNVGAEGFWAQGADAGELQLTHLSDFFSFTIADANSPAAMDLAFADLMPGATSPFDFTNNNAGVVGCSLFGRYQLADNIAMGAKIAYMTPEDEEKTLVDNMSSLTVWADYMLGSNTSFTLLYNIASPEDDDTVADTEYEDMNTLYGRFMITF